MALWPSRAGKQASASRKATESLLLAGRSNREPPQDGPLRDAWQPLVGPTQLNKGDTGEGGAHHGLPKEHGPIHGMQVAQARNRLLPARCDRSVTQSGAGDRSLVA